MRKRTRIVFETLVSLTRETEHTPTIRQIAEDIADGNGNNILSDVFYCLQELKTLGLVGVLRKPPKGIYIPLVSEVNWEALTKGDSGGQDAER